MNINLFSFWINTQKKMFLFVYFQTSTVYDMLMLFYAITRNTDDG